MWDFIISLVLFLAGSGVGFVYIQFMRAAWRAFMARDLDRPQIWAALVALFWPVTLPVLKAYDLVMSSGEDVLMGSETFGYVRHETEAARERALAASVVEQHVEWQARVNYFYALGAEAEQAGDWFTGQYVAENLDFLLETEPLRPPAADKPKKIAKPKPVVKKPELPVSPSRPAVTSRVEIPKTYFCNVCAEDLATTKFELWRVAGICDPCFTEIHKGDE